MTIKEFLDFISQDGNHFAGFILTVSIVSHLIQYIFSRILPRKKK